MVIEIVCVCSNISVLFFGHTDFANIFIPVLFPFLILFQLAIMYPVIRLSKVILHLIENILHKAAYIIITTRRDKCLNTFKGTVGVQVKGGYIARVVQHLIGMVTLVDEYIKGLEVGAGATVKTRVMDNIRQAVAVHIRNKDILQLIL